MIINRDKTHTHLHVPHWQFYLILFLVLTFIGALGFIIYRYYRANYYDSSLNGSEIKETQQQTIPQDVQQFLKQIQNATSAAQQTPSIKSSIEFASTVRVPILMYHYVEYVKDKGDKIRLSLNTTPYTLEQEIKTLSDAHFTFMTNSELADVLSGKSKLPPKPILLTFDDGYRDFYTDAYPILKKYHAKATQYVIAGFLDRSNHLTTAQLQEIGNDGLVEIGAHTVHHVWLKGRSLKDVNNEVFQSKVILQKIINKPVVSFAYPFGAFDEQAIQVVRDAGFTSATSTIPGIDQKQEYRYFLYRLRPGGRTDQSLLDFLSRGGT